jgi:protein phosphatase 1 regulatory subunit 7
MDILEYQRTLLRSALLQELDLVHSRLKDLDNLHLERFANHLKKLCLRTNYISKLDPTIFHQLTELEELDLYDNRIVNGKKHKKGGDETDGIKDALDNMSKISWVHIARNLV